MITSFLNNQGTIRVVVADTTKIANELNKLHRFSYPVSKAMSAFVTGATLISSTLKGKDVLGCYLDCNGPCSGLRVEVNTYGDVKGYSLNPQAGLDEFDKTYALTQEQLINGGKLTVTKVLKGGKQPFTGSIEFEGGDIAFAFSKYLLISEQIKSAVLISNIVSKDNTVVNCKGLLVQAMPGASEEELEEIEKQIKNAKPFSKIIDKYKNSKQIVKQLFKSIEFEILSNRQLQLKCSCSEFKVVTVLKSFSQENLKQLLNENKMYSVKCEYCTKVYEISPKQLSETVN
jgi:molecular chaperone Hsp33